MLFRVGQLVNRIKRDHMVHRKRYVGPKLNFGPGPKLQKRLHPGIITGIETWDVAGMPSRRVIVIYDIRTGEKCYVNANENTVHMFLEEMNGV